MGQNISGSRSRHGNARTQCRAIGAGGLTSVGRPDQGALDNSSGVRQHSLSPHLVARDYFRCITAFWYRWTTLTIPGARLAKRSELLRTPMRGCDCCLWSKMFSLGTFTFPCTHGGSSGLMGRMLKSCC